MESTRILQTLLDLWDDLPHLVGPAWPEVSARLASLLRDMQTIDERSQQAWFMSEVILLFQPHPEAVQHLRGALRETEQERGRSRQSGETTSPEAAQTWDALVHELRQRAHPPVVTRYTDIACPRRVWLHTPRVSVVVRLTARPSAYSAALEHLAVREGVPVQVHIEAPGFTVLNAPQQETTILPDQDSPPVVFDLRPHQVGDTRITLDFYQGGNPLGTVAVPIECTAYEVAAEATASLSGPLHLETDAEPPDLVLHIAWHASPPTLSFKLWEEGTWHRFAPRSLLRDPATDAAGLYQHLAGLTVRADPAAAVQQHNFLSPAAVDWRVKALGQNLWRELIPDDLQAYYAAHRHTWRDRSLLIVSDEPHLPWELVWPYSHSHDWEDDTPWCGTLRVTRWLRSDDQGRGTPPPPTRLRLHRLAILVPTDADLPSAEAEGEVLRQLAAKRSIHDVSPSAATWEAVMQLLGGGEYDWFHVAAHGRFHPDTPAFSPVVWLQGQVSFTPQDIVGPRIEGHIAQQRPAFVWNVCDGGRLGVGLTGLAGWATRLVSTGAGLFIGPQWEITDENSLTFVEALYRALVQGKTVGMAVQQARLATRQVGDPTWLAYSVYAHPNARVTLPARPRAPLTA